MEGKFYGRCRNCGIDWEFEGYEISLEPWPHGVCPVCSGWVPVFTG